MKRIVDLAKNRGFVFQGSEIYGGLANTWDYGPLGSLLKENLKNLWIREFVQRRPDMVLLDAAILMNPQVWVASGHVGGFSDPLIDDKNTKERFRADKLMEEYLNLELARKMDETRDIILMNEQINLDPDYYDSSRFQNNDLYRDAVVWKDVQAKKIFQKYQEQY
jgi:glycyl-tRNA synthetase (class II)